MLFFFFLIWLTEPTPVWATPEKRGCACGCPCTCVGQARGNGTVWVWVCEREREGGRTSVWFPRSNCGAWEALLSQSNYYKWFMWPVKRACQGSYFISRKRNSAGMLSGSLGLNWQLPFVPLWKSFSFGLWHLVSAQRARTQCRQRPAREGPQRKENICKWERFLSFPFCFYLKRMCSRLLILEGSMAHVSLEYCFFFHCNRNNHNTKPLPSVTSAHFTGERKTKVPSNLDC